MSEWSSAWLDLRAFRSGDAEELAGVYRDAVRSVGREAYTPEQVAAWAEYPIDIEEFRARLSCGYTLIAEEEGRVIAFGQLDPVDHIAFLYCRGAYGRCGVGSTVYAALEAHALGQGVLTISVDASRLSRPFFEKKGYRVIEVEQSEWRGITFERFRMIKE